MKAVEALFEAQKIAFGPFIFQSVASMMQLGIFDAIHESREGLSIPQIAEQTGVSEYGVRVLVEMGAAASVLNVKDDHYTLSKIGYFLHRDEMTKINFLFTQDINYQGLFHLTEAIRDGKPAGLKTLGDWPTIYQGLSILPPKEKKSWFDFDHYYSDNSFDAALEIIFSGNPSTIYDIGGNTGKWALASTKYDPNVEVTIIDLPVQIRAAKENIARHPDVRDRIHYLESDMLDQSKEIPGGADVYWMSQFLDCFSEGEIEAILTKIKKNMRPGAKVYIMETFIDNQRFKAAEFSLIATSLYFTVIANGNSRMYSSSAMKYVIEKSGFDVVNSHSLHGDSFHTILECQLKR